MTEALEVHASTVVGLATEHQSARITGTTSYNVSRIRFFCLQLRAGRRLELLLGVTLNHVVSSDGPALKPIELHMLERQRKATSYWRY